MMLVGKAMCEGNKWYFYSRRTQSRISESGFWQALGIEESIYSSIQAQRVGTKKYNAFYLGQPNSDQPPVKTNWIMQEYRLNSDSTTKSSSRRRRNHSNIVSKSINMRAPFHHIY